MAVDASITMDGATNDGPPSDVAVGDAPSDRGPVDASDGGVIVTVDAGADAPDTGGPAGLRCGTTLTCNVSTQTCCSIQSVTSCVNGTSSTCPGDAGVMTVHCDYGGQCKPGEVCCGKIGPSQSGASACALATDCTGFPNIRLCRTASECGDAGKCTPLPPQTGVPWLNYCN